MPLVTVITPVYNGEAYLDACVASVRAQTFDDWEYVIVDNCSSDGSRSIAEAHAARDARIKVHGNSTVLPVIQSFNKASTFVSRGSRYLKFLCADDVLFPECLAKMVEVAEAHPTVRLVAAYKIHGSSPVCDGPAFPQAVLNGQEVCRRFFEGTLGFLGSPTDHLVRLPLPVENAPFDERYLHADIELWVRLLQESGDYGFVHQLLTFTRVHPAAVSGFAHVMGSGSVEFLAMVLEHGRAFLTEQDYRRLAARYRRRHARFLARAFVKVWDRRIWKYQIARMQHFGIQVSAAEMLLGAASELLASGLSPAETMRRARRERARVRTTAGS